MRSDMVVSTNEQNTRESGTRQHLSAGEAVREAAGRGSQVGLANLAAYLGNASEEFLRPQECEKHGLMIPRGEPCYRCVIDANKARFVGR
jgi:hypothetical protein